MDPLFVHSFIHSLKQLSLSTPSPAACQHSVIFEKSKENAAVNKIPYIYRGVSFVRVMTGSEDYGRRNSQAWEVWRAEPKVELAGCLI